jgi:hypothetical protein
VALGNRRTQAAEMVSVPGTLKADLVIVIAALTSGCLS